MLAPGEDRARRDYAPTPCAPRMIIFWRLRFDDIRTETRPKTDASRRVAAQPSLLGDDDSLTETVT